MLFDDGKNRLWGSGVAATLVLTLTAGCAQSYTTRREKTAKGAGIGAAAGAVGALLLGKSKADQILVGAAIGAVVGGGVGAYMDAQEEKLAHIPGTTVERESKDTLVIHFDSDVLFAVDKADLTDAARGTLGQVADVIDEYEKTAVVVQGHTDSTGSEEHNKELSDRRASSVRGFLVERGVATKRIDAEGFGEAYPVADNDTAAGRQQNRRVEILLKARAI
jgi:outer membrane protein OmpA-like peptidoglycan-associated protein